jgi:hypothetical protein
MIEWKLQLKKGYTAQAYFSSKLLKRRHKGNKLTRRKDKHKNRDKNYRKGE